MIQQDKIRENFLPSLSFINPDLYCSLMKMPTNFHLDAVIQRFLELQFSHNHAYVVYHAGNAFSSVSQAHTL